MTPESTEPGRIERLLEEARAAEREQALVYRSLAARAEAADDPELAQRFHDLHADEQHHLSRLTARLLELRALPRDLSPGPVPEIPLDGWERDVARREEAEIDRYRAFLQEDPDPVTAALIREILAVEEHHAAELGGKWTMA